MKQTDSKQQAKAPKPLTEQRGRDSSQHRPYTAEDNEADLKAIRESIRENAGKPMF